jgi:hypothetical protein
MAPPKNLYHRRLVADSAAKACWICFKPSATVLATPEPYDYFYICPGHLKDPNFAIAKDAEDLAEKKRQEAVEKEIEAVKREFEEKMRKKLDRRKQKEYEKQSGEVDTSKDAKKEDEDDEKAKDAKVKELEKKKEGDKTKVDGPRIFELQKCFWQMRQQKKRDTDMAKMNKRRYELSDMPNVPDNDPSK